MEVYKVEIEAPGIDFCWYYIFAKSKESATEIYREYSKPFILSAPISRDILKIGEYRTFLANFGKLKKLHGITSSSKIEGVKTDLGNRTFSWKKS